MDRVDDPANLIEAAYAYFGSQIGSWLSENNDSGSAMELLTVTLCDLLKFVSITLEPGDNAQVIFETLNARGTPLLALDLVKNAVFHEASKQSLDIDRIYDDVWKPQLEDDYWREQFRDRDVVVALEIHLDLLRSEVIAGAQVDDLCDDLAGGRPGADMRPLRAISKPVEPQLLVAPQPAVVGLPADAVVATGVGNVPGHLLGVPDDREAVFCLPLKLLL